MSCAAASGFAVLRATRTSNARSSTACSSFSRRNFVSTSSLVAGSTGIAALIDCDPASASEAIEREESLQRYLARLAERVHTFQLPCGLRFVVYPRPDAPIVSFNITANVGAFVEEEGQTGLAHFLEHMAFKGSSVVGTSNEAAERQVRDAQDEVFAELCDLRGNAASDSISSERAAKIGVLEAKLASLIVEENKTVRQNEYGQLLKSAGGVGLNAQTGYDDTQYYVSLPCNQIELWFALEAERFRRPVFRQMHSERQVILQERRQRIDSSPGGRFLESFQAQAFGNNYRRPVIGFQQDIEQLRRTDVAAFFQQHYGPDSLSIAIVGDVVPEEVERLATKYFGGWLPASAGGDLIRAGGLPVGPSSIDIFRKVARPDGLQGNSAIVLPSQSGPAAHVCYYRPAGGVEGVPIALDAIGDVLSGSRSARAYRSLVSSGKCLGAAADTAFPSDKFDCAVRIIAVPSPSSSVDAAARQCRELVKPLLQEEVSATELERVRLQALLGVAQATRSNASLANMLASYQSSLGSWSTVLRQLDSVRALTKADLQSAAQQVFVPDNSFEALMPRSKK